MRKINNHYLIIKKGEEWYDYTQESFGKYFIYRTTEEALNGVLESEYTYHTIGEFGIYIIIEPTTDGKRNKLNNQIRLLRNLTKANIGFTKTQAETLINRIKLVENIKKLN